MSFTNFLENEILDQIFGAQAYTAPVTLYVGLSTTTPTDSGSNFTEPAGGSYARVAVTNNKTNFDVASSGALANATAVTFPAATGSWGACTFFGIFDASSGGNCLATGALDTTKNIDSGDTASFAIGALDVTLD